MRKLIYLAATLLSGAGIAAAGIGAAGAANAAPIAHSAPVQHVKLVAHVAPVQALAHAAPVVHVQKSGGGGSGSVTVQAGDTLSGIAASNGVSLSALEAANPQFSNPDLILVGQVVHLSGSGGTSAAPTSSGDHEPDGDSDDPATSSSSGGSSSPTTSAPVSTGGGQFSIPGMPQSLTNCIAFRESTNGTNPAANGNVFGIIPASGYNVAGDSIAQQEQVAGQIYASVGGSAWAADGCPGT